MKARPKIKRGDVCMFIAINKIGDTNTQRSGIVPAMSAVGRIQYVVNVLPPHFSADWFERHDDADEP